MKDEVENLDRYSYRVMNLLKERNVRSIVVRKLFHLIDENGPMSRFSTN